MLAAGHADKRTMLIYSRGDARRTEKVGVLRAEKRSANASIERKKLDGDETMG